MAIKARDNAGCNHDGGPSLATQAMAMFRASSTQSKQKKPLWLPV